MEKRSLDKIREQLLLHKENLTHWFRNKSEINERILCVRDPEEIPENELVTHKIDQTLDKIESGDYGKCTLCDGEVEEERLALDFTTCVCLDHYSEAQIRELERDLELAAKVQKQLLPHRTPEISGLQLAVRSEPSKIVGGDYFDFFPFRKTLQAFTIADVMGKGLPASMLMSNLQASLRILGPENNTLHKTVSRLNELFRFNLKTIRFITLVIAAIDMENRQLLYCNAGHNPPLWLKKGSDKFEVLNPTGPALGILSDPHYRSDELTFASGDMFLFYTDGLTEASDGREEFGERRLKDFLYKNSGKPGQEILNLLFRTVKAYANGSLDDLTALLIKID